MSDAHLLLSRTLPLLRNGKNLLAFSAGVDSSALYFLLQEHNISFDIAIVHYHRRPQAHEEVKHAQTLAQTHNKMCHIAHAHLKDTNFEAHARTFRYTFFEELITTHHYTNLITAHQLDDKFEWMMMQFCRGAGVVEMLGFPPITSQKGYTLLRPLIETTKAQLIAYLEKKGHPYFFDESNDDPAHLRNTFRHTLAPLIEKYHHGMKKSFEYLSRDALLLSLPPLTKIQELTLFETSDETTTMRTIDRIFKTHGIVLTKGQRDEIIRQKMCVISNIWVVSYQERVTMIAPFVKQTMPKNFKELCRKAHIPPLIRSYLFSAQIPLHDVLQAYPL